jgi:hypothetical protein
MVAKPVMTSRVSASSVYQECQLSLESFECVLGPIYGVLFQFMELQTFCIEVLRNIEPVDFSLKC